MSFLPRPRAHAPTRQDDPRDDGPLADVTSGVMWLATAAIGVAVLVLPGTLRTHLGWAFALAGFAAGWGGYRSGSASAPRPCRSAGAQG